MVSENKEYILGIDIGGTNIRIGMVDRNNTLHNFICEKSNSFIRGEKSLEELESYISKYIKLNNMDQLIAIAIGFPATISKDKKIIISSPNIQGFNNINIVASLESMFNVPVFIDKDVNFLLEYEIMKRKLIGNKIILGFYIGTGFGNSIYINGNFLNGKNGVAGELGHIPVLDNLFKCSCGNIGCIETLSSGKRLEELRKIYFPDTNIRQVFKNHKHDSIIKSFIQAIAVPIATEINIFDPHYVIIGGGVVRMMDFPNKLLENYIYKYSRKPFPATNLTILYAQAGQEMGVLGGAHYARNRLKTNLKQ